MALSIITVQDRAGKIASAWKKSAAVKTFGDLTVDQYEALRTVVTTADAAVTTAEAALTEKRNLLADAVNALNTASKDVANGVRGDKSVGGANGSLYEEMGYVRDDERKSGLTRKKPPSTPAP